MPYKKLADLNLFKGTKKDVCYIVIPSQEETASY